MMMLIKVGTVEWRAGDTPAPGEVAYSGPYVYEADGATPAMVWDDALQTVRPRTEAESKAATVARIVAAIKSDRDRRRVAGCPVGAHVFHSDDSSRIQQIGLVMLGQAIPAGLKWKAMSGTLVDMTPTLAGQIFGAQAARDAALFAHAEGLIAAVAAAADPTTVDITAGWPT